MAGILLDTELDAEQRRSATTIRESAETLLRILNDILDFSKLEAGAMQIETTPFDLHELLRYTVEIVAPRTRARPVTLDLVISPDVPRYVRSDPGRVRQVILNFLGNAAKFTERGSIVLHVSAINSKLRVEVRDTGIGISPDKLHLLFNTFQQTDAAVARKFGGTGLGLAISKRLIELLDGTVGVQSATNVGSNFWFEIPLVLASAEEVARGARAGAGSEFDNALSRIKALGRPLRILIAEDNATNLLVAKSVLQKFDIVPDVAGNGIEAVEAVRRLPYDVVLMDVHMPQMDGIEATRAIRSLPGDGGKIPIIALTANAFADDINKCRAAGMNGHLGKPFRREDLIIAISDALAHRSVYANLLARSGDKAEGSETIVDWAVLDTFKSTVGDETLKLLVDTYVSSTADLLAKFAQIVRANGDVNEAMRLAHSLKSSSAQAGAPTLSKIAAALEASAADRRPISEADIGEVTRLFDAYKAALTEKGLLAA
jgi:CheY-like chemotaxis protein